MTIFNIKTYVKRGRKTQAQQRAYLTCWSQVGLSLANREINFCQAFAREAPCFLEIGFGSGQSLLALALANPQFNFIGVETHFPGIGGLCMGIQQHQLTNIRLFYEDAQAVLNVAIPQASLSGVQIFFPDPWPKRRHYARRIIQPAFISKVVEKLLPRGFLHLATDWDDYAKHMMSVISAESRLINLAGKGKFAQRRSSQRLILTKFEERAIKEGRSIWELHYARDIS